MIKGRMDVICSMHGSLEKCASYFNCKSERQVEGEPRVQRIILNLVLDN
jgi:hypothetical protein